MLKRTTLAALATATATAAVVLAGPPSAQAAPTPHALPHSAPAWLAHAHDLGPAAADATVAGRVYLAPRGGLDALQVAASAVSTPGSPSYQHFLTPAQYRATYGPTMAAVRGVQSWLASAGLRVTGVEAQRRYVSISGTVAEANKAFATTIRRYRHDGHAVQAPSSAVRVPAAQAAAVLTVTGLDTTPHLVRPASAQEPNVRPPSGFRNARPCSLFYGQLKARYQADYATPLPKYKGNRLTYAPCGYTGPQFRGAYEGTTALTGAGVSVAITDAYASSTMLADAQTYARNNGDPDYATRQYTQTVDRPFSRQADCGPSGWSGEQTLDVEAVHAMAPGANIRYYGARNCYDEGFLDVFAKILDENRVQLVTNSWGDTTANTAGDVIPAYQNAFLQGALQGISFTFSSGDSGDDLQSSGTKQTDYPTSDPYVTAVGGTSTGINRYDRLSFQTGWGTHKYSLSADGQTWRPIGFLYGAGGGYSSLFNRPAYQDGTVSNGARAIPDVAMDADPTTGMLIGQTQSFPDGVYYDQYRIGGTSLASPLFAGMTALRVEANGGVGFGLLNPSIYDPANRADFTDVRPVPSQRGAVRVDFANGLDPSAGLRYSVRTFNQDSSLRTTRGWDEVTGLGSPNRGWLRP